MMPPRFAFTATNPIYNREIITKAFVSAPSKEGARNALLQVKALWDTGATNSVMTPHVVAQLGIKPDGVTRTLHAGGENIVNTYLVNIALPNNIVLPNIRVSECKEQDGRFDIIIGMDIISLGDFSVTGQGMKRSVSFCLPSIGIINYAHILRQIDNGQKVQDTE